MKRVATIALGRMTSPQCTITVVVFALGLTIAARADEPPPAAVGANPVQVEMRLLEAAMRDSVSAIAAGDVRALPQRLHAVHVAGGDTKSALRSGAYKPPRGATQTKVFIALDDEFHAEMIQMVKAASKNDVAATATHFGGLMKRCTGCHTQFRAAPPRP